MTGKKNLIGNIDDAIRNILEVRNTLANAPVHSLSEDLAREPINEGPNPNDFPSFDFAKLKGGAFGMDNELTKEMAKPPRCGSASEEPVIKDRLQATLDDNQRLIRELNQMERRAVNWEETAKGYARNADFYQDICSKIASELGAEAYIDDEGQRVDSVISLKLLELVKLTIKEVNVKTSLALRLSKEQETMQAEIDNLRNLNLTYKTQLNTTFGKVAHPHTVPEVGDTEKLVDSNVGNLVCNLQADIRDLNTHLSDALKQRNKANAELVETNDALKRVVHERDDLKGQLRFMHDSREFVRDELNNAQERNAKLMASEGTLCGKIRDLMNESDKLKKDFEELNAAYHGVNRAYNDLQRRASNARNALDLRID